MELDTIRKRLLIRSWRRGTKELDLILGGFSNDNLSKLEWLSLSCTNSFYQMMIMQSIIGCLEKKKAQKIFTT